MSALLKPLAMVLGIIAVCMVAAWYLRWFGAPQPHPAPESPAPRPATSLTVVGEDSSNLRAMQSLADRYKAATGVKVEFVPLTFEQLQTQSTEDLRNHTARFDIILNYNFSLASYVRNNWVLTLAETKELLNTGARSYAFESDIIEPVWRELGYFRRNNGPTGREEPIGYPFAANTMLLVYSRPLFESETEKTEYRTRYGEALQPPTTWAQFRRVAEHFSRRPPLKGLSLQGSSDGWLYYEWANFAYSMGGGVMNKQFGWDSDQHTPLTLTSKATIDATEFYMSLRPFATPTFFGNDALAQREELRRGAAVMAIMWSDYTFDLLYEGGARHDREFGFAPIPGKASMLAGGTFFINRDSQKTKAAAEFIHFLMQRPQQVELAQKGLASPLRSIYAAPYIQSIPYAAALRTSLERGIYMNEAAADSTIISTILTQQLQRMWRGEAAVADGMAAATRQIMAARQSAFGQ